MAAARNYNVIWIIVFGLTRTDLTNGQGDLDCHINKATECYTNRQRQFNDTYSKFLEDKQTDSLKPICLTQIRSDAQGECFDDATNLCREEEAAAIKTEWDQLNSNITDTCKAVCPNLLDIIDCKNMTDMSGLQTSKFESFCSTFNMSLICAKEVLGDCQFGMKIYSDIVDRKLLQYWTHICNSGCTNIDATIGVLTSCDKHLKDKSLAVCVGHFQFKECVLDSPVVCDRVMQLVRLKYRNYDTIERICTTTTTSSTVTTSRAGSSTNATILPTTPSTSTTPTIAPTTASTRTTTTIPPITRRTRTSTIPTETVLNIEGCLPYETMASLNSSDLNIANVMLLLKFESCLHNLTDDTRIIEDTIRALPVAFQQFYHHAKQDGWQLLAQTMSHCRPSRTAATSDCTGHLYGLIPCSSAHRSVPAIVLNTFLYGGLCILLSLGHHL